MGKDLYKILNLTEEDKKLPWDEFDKKRRSNYLKLSKQWHPDRHVNDSKEDKEKAEEKFKEISAANEVLSDKTKKEQYDNGGNPFGEGSPFADFFSHMGGFGGFGDFFGGGFGGGQHENVGDSARVNVEVTLEDLYNGNEVKFNYYRYEPCDECNGTGSKDGKSSKCPHCNGTGRVVERRQFGPGQFMQNISACPHCGGTGIKIDNPCKKCGGSGLKRVMHTETIEVPNGIMTGNAISIPGLGHYPQNGGRPGNLIVVFNVKDDNYFKRVDNLNLVHEEEVDFVDCLLGCKKEIKCIDGKKIMLTIPECTPDNKAFIVKGKGLKYNGGYGDFAVVVKYKIPKTLSKKQKEALENYKKG